MSKTSSSLWKSSLDGLASSRVSHLTLSGAPKKLLYCTEYNWPTTNSPTTATESLLLTSIVNAAENRDVAIIDILNAFIQTRVENEKDCVIIRIQGVVGDWLVTIAPKVYSQYVTVGKKGDKQLLVECKNAIYGTMVAVLLCY
jgi:hypothetical protein